MVFLLLIAVLATTACSRGDDAGDVRDFAEIADSDPVIEFDPSGTAATIRVITTVDAACAVVYGMDGAFGSIATDQEMGGGGGHSYHTPVLTGLELGTQYQYRLQGVTADGTLYQSEMMTFTTPSGESSGAFGPNAAIGATVTDVSSEFSAGFVADMAIDGDLATEWSSDGDGDDAFITIDLGRRVQVTAVGFRTRSMSDGSATTATFTVEVDSTVYGPFPAGDTPSAVAFRGQVLTYRVETSTGGNTGAVEIEAYEAA